MALVGTFFKLRRTTTQSIADATSTAVVFDTADYDTVSGWESGHKSRWLVPSGQGGFYVFWAHVAFSHGPINNAPARRLIGFQVNGGSTIYAQQSEPNIQPGSVATELVTSSPIALVDGDYVELIALQNSQSTLSLSAGVEFSGLRFGDGTLEVDLVRSTSQSIPSGVTTPITFDTAVADPLNLWDALHKSRIIAREDGTAYLWANVAFFRPTGLQGPLNRLLAFRVNGDNSQLHGQVSCLGNTDTASVNTQLSISDRFDLKAGDYVEVVVQQGTGALLNIAQGAVCGGAFVSGVDSYGFDLKRTTNLSLPSVTNVNITFDTAVVDALGGWNASDKSQWIVPASFAGVYILWANAGIVPGADTNATRRLISFLVNGALATTESRASIDLSGVPTRLSTFGLFHLSVGDVVQVLVRQDSTSTTTVQAAGNIQLAGAPIALDSGQ